MRVKITGRGAYDQDGKLIAEGTTINVDGDVLPPWLVNKAEVISGGGGDRVAVTNPARKAD